MSLFLTGGILKILMNTTLLTRPLFSLSDVIREARPREAVEKKLIALLQSRLKKSRIAWNPKAFQGGLGNPALPAAMLKKLETILWLAEAIDWRLSRNLKNELDETVEDIESFNPPFRASLRQAADDFKAGRFVTQEQLEARHQFS